MQEKQNKAFFFCMVGRIAAFICRGERGFLGVRRANVLTLVRGTTNPFHTGCVQEKQEKQEKVLSCAFSCRKRAHPCFFCFTFKPLANIAHVIFQN